MPYYRRQIYMKLAKDMENRRKGKKIIRVNKEVQYPNSKNPEIEN